MTPIMQTVVFTHPKRKNLDRTAPAAHFTAGDANRTVTQTTIRGADLRLARVEVPVRKPGRILTNADAGYVDDKAPAFTDL